MGNNVIKDWKKRWVIMKSDKLEYYRNKLDATPAGSISLVSSHVNTSPIRQFCMEIITPTRSYWFAGENQPEITDWINSIIATTARLMESFIEGVKQVPQPIPSKDVRFLYYFFLN